MEKDKLSKKFVQEIEKLTDLKKDYFDNKTSFKVKINMDDDIIRRTVVNDIVKSIQSKVEKNLYIKYQNSFRFYDVMTQYKKKYDEEGSKKLIGINDAYKHCQISTREFYILSDMKWNSFSKLYEFNDQYKEDYSYWKVKKRDWDKESEEESDKTISDLGE
ncbi:76_t:CDS:2 [Funneliformis geosporum]|uniref:2462_t:CDS:1 n=1 Tax=Funneliformis geosporum TaxID=1117311 RepID=A0A9W4SRB3_9GLOM|nr:76_t:CDS:2 [Funneliformis geosporum]CAI2178593.1 2462_t:CDS:2 [Funneliformis geosporum]